jgi:hypothetical protein
MSDETTITTTRETDNRPWYRRKTTGGLILLAVGLGLSSVAGLPVVAAATSVTVISIAKIAADILVPIGSLLSGYGLWSRNSKK